MSMATADTARLLLALALILCAAHACGYLFVVLRQPRVIGEIVGGLLLGATVLGTVAPELQAQLFPTEGPTRSVLGACYQLGLMLLMFCSGAEMRTVFRRGEERTVTLVTISGIALPFVAGLLLFVAVDPQPLIGPANSRTALILVSALAIAVTSIPVISRIMSDLGVLGTSFARIVLGVAVIEDLIVYVVLAIALGLVSTSGGSEFGVAGLLGLEAGTTGALVFHVAATLILFTGILAIGPRAFRWSRHRRWNALERSNPVAYHVVFLFAVTLLTVALGITPMVGAFLAGVAASTGTGPRSVIARESIRTFSFAFFVPVYFALVGFQLDLARHFNVLFFAWFFAFACAAKALSVYLGARVAGEDRFSATNLAIAMNARGGPGIVLAGVSYEAEVISAEFYAALVMLAVVTSLLAGSWLGRLVRSGRPLRVEPPAEKLPGSPAASVTATS